ncbi:DoxX family protein [bacterium]|nr:DoxX family protein [bacterium]
MSLKQILYGGTETSSPAANFGLLVLRVFTGLSLALAHGMGKFPPSGKFIDGVGDLGFPVPLLFAWLASLSELLGGFLLALGLFTRPTAFMIAVTMGVAGFMQHADDPFATMEKALLFFAIAVAFLFIGAGKYSIDKAVK